jgi:Fur family peroxide stress response transcriptional regulator
VDINELKNRLAEKGLKVTPQRIAVMEAIIKLKNHPAADNIIDYIRKNQPSISTATVYKILDTLVEKELIKKVKTERDIMRYDAFTDRHHHLYCSQCDKIVDYNDEELNEILEKYFEKKAIPNFRIEDIKLQIIGQFTNIKKDL